MTGTGIRKLAVGFGLALVLAGCETGPTGNGGDPAAAALDSGDVSTTSLDAPGPEADAAVDPAAVAAAPDTFSDPVVEPAAPARRGLFGFLKPRPKQPEADAALPGLDPSAPQDGAVPDVEAIAAAALADEPVAGAATDEAVPAPDAGLTEAEPVKERRGLFGFLKPKPAGAGTATAAATPTRPSVRMVDRDVEAPDVFQVSDSGLWDGRPSLGGVWVAYSEVTDPERVIIRNLDTGAFVIGALFRRERENPGPRLQVSSDAADALGMLAGAPAKLNVTALRREEVVDPADASALLGGAAEIEQTAIDPAAASAAEAIEAAPAAQPAQRPATEPAGDDLAAAAPAPQPAAASSAPSGGKNFLQVGIFSIEDNAKGTAGKLQSAGLTARVIREESQGKTYWRVIAGPAGSSAERDSLLAKVKGLGFGDAYFVSG